MFAAPPTAGGSRESGSENHSERAALQHKWGRETGLAEKEVAEKKRRKVGVFSSFLVRQSGIVCTCTYFTENVASTLHLWIADSSTNIFHLEVILLCRTLWPPADV